MKHQIGWGSSEPPDPKIKKAFNAWWKWASLYIRSPKNRRLAKRWAFEGWIGAMDQYIRVESDTHNLHLHMEDDNE